MRKTNLTRTLICLLVLATLFSTVACSSKSAIVGKWMLNDQGSNKGTSITFNADGTLVMDNASGMYKGPHSGTYSISKDQLTMNIEGVDTTSSYKISGNTLTIDYYDIGSTSYTKAG